MRPTGWQTVLPLLVLTAALGWLLADHAYGDLVALPGGAPVTATVIAVFELALARVVSRKVQGRSAGRPMHPLQVARAAVLGKASAVTGALLGGFYAGFFLWVARRNELRAARHDTWVSLWSAVACLALLVAGLVLERACRTPPPRDEMQP